MAGSIAPFRRSMALAWQRSLPTSDVGGDFLQSVITVFLLSLVRLEYLPSASQPLHTGFATFLVSFAPVLSSTNSFQLTGTIWFPASLTAITTPSSFFAVLQK